MPKYLIERTVPNAGQMSKEQLRDISQKSNEVLRELTHKGNSIQWVESYVTDNQLHCVYIASDPEVIREHARCGGFPVDSISEVGTIISPATGE